MITVAEEVERAVELSTNYQQSLMGANLNQNMVDQQNLTSSIMNHKPAKRQ